MVCNYWLPSGHVHLPDVARAVLWTWRPRVRRTWKHTEAVLLPAQRRKELEMSMVKQQEPNPWTWFLVAQAWFLVAWTWQLALEAPQAQHQRRVLEEPAWPLSASAQRGSTNNLCATTVCGCLWLGWVLYRFIWRHGASRAWLGVSRG